MRLVVLGGGESGVGTARLGKVKGYDVFLSDQGRIADKFKKELNDSSILWEEGQHTESLILNADLVMKSPGIPDSATLIKKISEKGIPIVSEIEFASWFDDAINIAITGSNGKTTTTTLDRKSTRLNSSHV